MADAATQRTTISAPPDRCWAVALDFDRYPDWARDVKEAVVAAYDDEGRPLEVDFTASAMGRSTHYRLRYDYSGAPETLSWKLVSGDIMRGLEGSYRFSPSTTEPGGTDVTYDLAVELQVALPGFVKRRAEVRILATLRELKARAELQVA